MDIKSRLTENYSQETEEKINILIADSESLVRKNLSIILEKENKYNIFIAKDGIEVIEILKENNIDLILINCILPKVNGYDIVSLIRKAEEKEIAKLKSDTNQSFCESNTKQNLMRYTYIISFIEDSSILNKMIELVISSGADDFITKPFSLDILMGKIKSAERIITLQRIIRRTYKKIQELSTMDMLCNIYNRKSIITRLKKSLCLAGREHKAVAVFMLDIDHFKKINDTYGHQFGDIVLRDTAHIIKTKCCRTYDELGRYGGEEFLLIIPLYSDIKKEINIREGVGERIKQAKAISQRILDIVSAQIHKYKEDNSEKDVSITVSIGITIADFTRPASETSNNQSDTPNHCIDNNEIEKLTEEIIGQADKALYAAKDSGRNTYVFFGELKNTQQD